MLSMESSPSLSTSSEPSTQREYRDWLELPRDVISTILLKLGSIEILTSAQGVCRLWRKICRDPTMWRVVDMRNSGDTYWRYDLQAMCQHAIDRSCGQLIDINIEHFGTDDLVKYITASTSQLRRLRLVHCPCVTDEGLNEAASGLPLLEELELSYCYAISQAPLKDFGRSCPHLKSLKLNSQGVRNPDYAGNEEALAIAENMPNLTHLMIFGNTLTNEGLKAILDGCPHLESLDLRQCFHVNLQEKSGRSGTEKIRTLRLPNDSTEDYEFVAEVNDVMERSSYWLSDNDDFLDDDFLYGEYDNYGFSLGSDDSDYEGLLF